MLCLMCAFASNLPAAELPTKRILTLDAAKQVAAAAEAEAKRRGSTVVIVVVDDGGHVLLLERLDDTQVASIEVGIGKARTAAIFRRPSKEFEDQVRNGRVAALALPGATPLQGGIPIVVDGKVLGAIGVSAGRFWILTTLDKRRSTGRLCFNWYRIRLTIPDRAGNFDPAGSTVVFETSLDDYAEIWVDGELDSLAGSERRIGRQRMECS